MAFRAKILMLIYGLLAQLVEHSTLNRSAARKENLPVCKFLEKSKAFDKRISNLF